VRLNVFAHELGSLGKAAAQQEDNFLTAVRAVHKRRVGGYAAIAMVHRLRHRGFRDPNAIARFVFGQGETQRTVCGVHDRLGKRRCPGRAGLCNLIRDLEPGRGCLHLLTRVICITRQFAPKPQYSPCISNTCIWPSGFD